MCKAHGLFVLISSMWLWGVMTPGTSIFAVFHSLLLLSLTSTICSLL